MDLSRRDVMRATASIMAGQLCLPALGAAPGTAPAGAKYGRVRDVNATSIPDAIRLACRTMANVFDPADGNVPYFGSSVRPRPFLAFSDNHSEAHVPGRHLNALLHAEASVGVAIDEETIANHRRAAFLAYGGAAPLPLNRAHPKDARPTRFLPHNLREGFHALYALAHYRKDAAAGEMFERSVAAIATLWSPEQGWDRRRLEGELGLRLIEWPGPLITGIGRAVGPLVKYFVATGHSPALRLALRLKDRLLAECFTAEGGYDLARFGTHTHSTTCVMSSLAQLAEATGDAPLMERVRRFFDNGLTAIADPIGWSIENAAPQSAADRGEANNTGDILETALILGRAGYGEYFDRAELILRAHLLPSQLRDVGFIDPAAVPVGGGMSIAQRHVGAFGFPAPYGHQPVELDDVSFNMDIVGGATDSLAFAHDAAITTTPAGLRVNLLFDGETEAVKVESPYTNAAGTLRITPKKNLPLWVRIPRWVDRSTLAVAGLAVQPIGSDGYLFLGSGVAGQPIELSRLLSSRQLVLRHRTREIRVRLRGDEVVAMDNFGADLTYFEPFE